ncbi:hypothetical protein ONZ43_g2489 [Nemania bipapillata]|uniref:Uncharacterized protein n=1 Tax=Nemania bipapillata TaxID=110536 RepID=A0ACC2J0G7_9PEZI|nr:hypothetical protein ONZ43_g2489 [Nemania bipapillata]
MADETALEDFPSLFSLKGKVAVVTGGSRGLGLNAASARMRQGLHHVAEGEGLRGGRRPAEQAPEPAAGRARHLGAGGQRHDGGRRVAAGAGVGAHGARRYLVR